MSWKGTLDGIDWAWTQEYRELGTQHCTPSRRADLNKYEAAAGGEFNIGTAQQYGEADIKGKDFHDEVCFLNASVIIACQGAPRSIPQAVLMAPECAGFEAIKLHSGRLP